MSWTLLALLVLVPALGVLALLARRLELQRMRTRIEQRESEQREARASDQLQQPVIDLSRCLGCATCVAACPEAGVLDIVHGQAAVMNGGRCVGVSACERECPVDAISVSLARVEERDDIPALTPGLEAVGVPGLFLAGEVTAHALVKTAVDHGTAVAATVAARLGESGGGADEPTPAALDLCIVGAGPAGLACALEAKRLGLKTILLDQESSPGGTVAKYPRRKLVLTEPLDLPLHGRLRRRSYGKEELVELWERLVREHELPLESEVRLQSVGRPSQGGFSVQTNRGSYHANSLCLAIGRRGTPRRLDVPGEDLPKVAYSLLDARSYQGRRTLIVGAGDSAVEAALALAEQEGNVVTLLTRGASVTRPRQANRERLERATARGEITLMTDAQVHSILEHEVHVRIVSDESPAPGKLWSVPNDDVFVMAGGIAPQGLLNQAGVSFDPADRPQQAPPAEQGAGLLKALIGATSLAVVALLFAVWNADYYLLPTELRPEHHKHQWLRPGLGFGLWLGVLGVGLILVNLAYLVRRASWGFRFGSLRTWMSTHVATGVLALLCALLHAGMSPRNTVGGHAFWALSVLLITGGLGRYFYAWVPRAANGRELELAEVKAGLRGDALSAPDVERWSGGQRRFREQAEQDVLALVDSKQWGASFPARALALVGVRRDLAAVLRGIEQRGRDEGVEAVQVDETLLLAKKGYRSALMAAHVEDLRGLLATWRYVHRWFTLLMLVLLTLHVVYALKYGSFLSDEPVMDMTLDAAE